MIKTGEMEVKNPLFKEEFSSNNISGAVNGGATLPPAYSSVISTNQAPQEQLVQIESPSKSEAAPVVITVNESLDETKNTSSNENQNQEATTVSIPDDKQ
jgi:hypothetical protein